MGVKVYTTEIKLSGWASVERECSNCKSPWTEKIKINATARGDGSWGRPDVREAQKAKEKAHQYLLVEEKRAKKQADKGVLCPSCNHFSTGAMAKHFPNGYLRGLKKKHLKASLVALLAIPTCGFGAVLLGPAIFDATPKDWKEAWYLIIFVAILALLLALGFFYNLAMGVRLLFGYTRVREYLRTKDERDLLDLAVSHYKENKNSLSGIYSWGESLMKRTGNREIQNPV